MVRGGSATHKDGHRIHVFRLNEFREDVIKPRSRIDVKDRRLEKTRGCHLYSTSKGVDGHLRMAVAVGKKLLTFQWKHTVAWTSWCPNSDNDTIDGFIFFREVSLHDSPTILTILETPVNSRASPSNGFMVCVGYKHHFEIVSEHTGHSTRLHETDSCKKSQTHLVAALDLCDGQETELLLCYNRKFNFICFEPFMLIFIKFQTLVTFKNSQMIINQIVNLIFIGIAHRHLSFVHSPI